MVIASRLRSFVRRKKERKKKKREATCSRRVGTFQLNCKLKRIFYSSVVSAIGSDRKYSKARATFPLRIKFAISVPFSFQPLSSFSSLDRENLDNLVNDFPNLEGKSNFVRDFQSAFSKLSLFPIQRMVAFLNLDGGFYSSFSPVLFLSIDLEHSALETASPSFSLFCTNYHFSG